MLPKKTHYAIKALTRLAQVYYEKKPLRASHISEAEKIPRKFLEAILLELKQKGFVTSRMGPTGGYLLARHPEEVMLSQVIRSTGGPIALLPCVSLNFYESCIGCPNENTCGLHEVMFEVREASLKILSKTSLTDLVLREKRLLRKIKK